MNWELEVGKGSEDGAAGSGSDVTLRSSPNFIDWG